jgi:hypothetical protein
LLHAGHDRPLSTANPSPSRSACFAADSTINRAEPRSTDIDFSAFDSRRLHPSDPLFPSVSTLTVASGVASPTGTPAGLVAFRDNGPSLGERGGRGPHPRLRRRRPIRALTARAIPRGPWVSRRACVGDRDLC